MRILYYFLNKPTMMDQWQIHHIVDELQHNGWQIDIFSPLDFSIEESFEGFCKKLEHCEYDLFMTPYGTEVISNDYLSEVDKYGIPKLLICFDNLIAPFMHEENACKFDLIWLTSRETKCIFDKWNKRSIVQPYASNPYLFSERSNETIKRVAFIGTPYGSRANMINDLTTHNVLVDLYSNIGKHSKTVESNITLSKKLSSIKNLLRFEIGRRVLLGAMKQKLESNASINCEADSLELFDAVPVTELSMLYSKYSLSLASTSVRNTGVLAKPVDIVNLRSFEIPMSGGLQICRYFDEIAEYFVEDEEIVLYRSKEELVEKARFYTKPENVALVNKMKNQARIRAQKEHTWTQRFKRVLEELDIKE